MSDKFVINCHDLYNYCFILCFFVLTLRKLFVKNKNRFTKKHASREILSLLKTFMCNKHEMKKCKRNNQQIKLVQKILEPLIYDSFIFKLWN